MTAAYDRIGRGYAQTRRPDPRIAARIRAALGDARSVVNVGAGAGAYEPEGVEVLAVEPSQVMIAQRPPGAAPAIQACAEALPLADGAVDAAMAVLTIHHWADARRGIAEMLRVARDRVVVVTLDPDVAGAMWLYEYAPEIAKLTRETFPPMAGLTRWLGGAHVEPVPIPRDCTDLFLEAFWSRPELVLDARARAGTSGFARLPPGIERRIVAAVRSDLRSGEWDRRHSHLRACAAYDGGLRILTSRAARPGGPRAPRSGQASSGPDHSKGKCLLDRPGQLHLKPNASTSSSMAVA